ncbi:MAG: hypothetical protein NC433_08060 [Clostridiales bacterium]|nr:hypothetical protein [Clostridiales bacterium]
MEPQKIKKTSVPYLLACIFIPILATVLITFIGILFLTSEIASALMMVSMTASIFWWVLGIKKVYEKKKEEKLKELDTTGFNRNHTFNSDNCAVAIDIANGKIAMIFKWNPSQLYVLPANRITKLWVDDGKKIGGTSRVSFLFIIDGIKIRVNTFISNKIWSMKSNNVLEAISKADMMVAALRSAAQAAQNTQYMN